MVIGGSKGKICVYLDPPNVPRPQILNLEVFFLN